MKEQSIDIPCKGRIRSWCNELLLIADGNEFGALYIFNLITKTAFRIPPSLCSELCGGHYKCKCGLVLTFDKFKRVYKVVHVVIHQKVVRCEILVFECNSLSLNHCKWEKIAGPAQKGERSYYWSDPISVEGRYLHWDVHSAEYILSMDVVNERFQETPLPEYGENFSLSTSYEMVERDGLLCLLLPVTSAQVDIWILKDFRRKVWEKLHCIRSLSYYASTTMSQSRIHPVPVTCFKNGSVIIFRKTGLKFGYFGYYLEYKHIEKLDIGIKPDESWVVQTKALDYR